MVLPKYMMDVCIFDICTDLSQLIHKKIVFAISAHVMTPVAAFVIMDSLESHVMKR